MRFSICIPTYEMGGYGHELLDELFNDLKKQTFKDFEIVVSDQSLDDKIVDVCNKHSIELDIVYIHYNENKGKAACNINNAMKNASGEIIKILYQDDYFVTSYALENISKVFDDDAVNWCINAFTHSNRDRTQFFNSRPSYYGDHVLIGENTVGNPSNISFRNTNNNLYMDESIVYVVDCEYYYRLNKQLGAPYVIPDVLVCARHHPVSAVDRPEFYNLKDTEVKYCLKKHNVIQ